MLAEPLEEDSDSHVQHFLDSHGGPGLQHIGLTAPNVSKTVEWMYERGAKFRTPPPTYYQLVRWLRSESLNFKSFTFMYMIFKFVFPLNSDDSFSTFIVYSIIWSRFFVTFLYLFEVNFPDKWQYSCLHSTLNTFFIHFVSLSNDNHS